MASAQADITGQMGPVTRKRRRLEEQQEKRREKVEMKKKVRKNTKTIFIEVDKSTGKVKIETKQEPEEEQNVVIVKEEIEVSTDNGYSEDLVGNPVGFQDSASAELILKESPVVTDQPIKVEVGTSEVEPKSMPSAVSDVYPKKAATTQVTTVSVGVGTDLLTSHFVPLEEFNKLKEEMRRTNEEWNKRFSCLEASFQALQQRLSNPAFTRKGSEADTVTVDMQQEKVHGSAIMDTEKLFHSCDAGLEEHSMQKQTSTNDENSAEPDDDRTLTLFPEVMGVIWDKYSYSMFNKADFLKSRSVCYTWKQGIDKIRNGPCQRFKAKRNITLLIGQFLWKDGQELEFQYDPDSGIILDSPVQPTKLTIEDARVQTTAEERAKCRKNIEEFLQKHGHVIKEFYSGMPKDSLQFEYKGDMQRTLSHWLNLMPNLEIFDFSSRLRFDERLPELDQFPTLPKLKSFSDFCGWPNDLLRKAVRNNPQISSLKVDFRNFTFKDMVLPQLRDLDLHHDFPFDLAELHAPMLETLRLTAENYLEPPVHADAVYEVLNKFRKSLQFLQIRTKIKLGEVVFPAMLRLRQLVFEFDFIDFFIGTAVEHLLQVISSSCPSLDHLVVALPSTDCSGDKTRRGRMWRRKRVQVQLFSKLKLWEALPSLKKVEWIYPFYEDEDQKFVFIRTY